MATVWHKPLANSRPPTPPAAPPMQRSDFRFFERLRVRWAEIDAQRIVEAAKKVVGTAASVVGTVVDKAR